MSDQVLFERASDLLGVMHRAHLKEENWRDAMAWQYVPSLMQWIRERKRKGVVELGVWNLRGDCTAKLLGAGFSKDCDIEVTGPDLPRALMLLAIEIEKRDAVHLSGYASREFTACGAEHAPQIKRTQNVAQVTCRYCKAVKKMVDDTSKL